jgi:hypothetical protein
VDFLVSIPDSVSVFLSNPMTFARDIEDLSQLVTARV